MGHSPTIRWSAVEQRRSPSRRRNRPACGAWAVRAMSSPLRRRRPLSRPRSCCWAWGCWRSPEWSGDDLAGRHCTRRKRRLRCNHAEHLAIGEVRVAHTRSTPLASDAKGVLEAKSVLGSGWTRFWRPLHRRTRTMPYERLSHRRPLRVYNPAYPELGKRRSRLEGSHGCRHASGSVRRPVAPRQGAPGDRRIHLGSADQD